MQVPLLQRLAAVHQRLVKVQHQRLLAVRRLLQNGPYFLGTPLLDELAKVTFPDKVMRLRLLDLVALVAAAPEQPSEQPHQRTFCRFDCLRRNRGWCRLLTLYYRNFGGSAFGVEHTPAISADCARQLQLRLSFVGVVASLFHL